LIDLKKEKLLNLKKALIMNGYPAEVAEKIAEWYIIEP
jgi:hypothetical protein